MVRDEDPINYFEVCAICLSPLVAAQNVQMMGQAVVKMICGHVYHPKCISDWRIRRDSCPLCKKWFNRDGYDDGSEDDD